MKDVKKILIVCTGNSCRSIMAEGYLNKRLAELGLKKIAVLSAGTGAISGFRPTGETVQVMRDHGVDVSGYLSSRLDKNHVQNADMVLVMEPRHKETILQMAPDSEKKIYLLRSFSSEKNREKDYVDDPIGMPIEFYRGVFEVIKDSIEGFLTWLKK